MKAATITSKSHYNKMDESQLKREAIKLKVAFNEKGVKHIFDFINVSYPGHKYDKAEFDLFINGRKADPELAQVCDNILKLISA
jgi:hypothetical protein